MLLLDLVLALFELWMVMNDSADRSHIRDWKHQHIFTETTWSKLDAAISSKTCDQRNEWLTLCNLLIPE